MAKKDTAVNTGVNTATEPMTPKTYGGVQILKTSADLTPAQVYHLTMSHDTQRMTDVKSQIIEVDSYALYTDVNEEDGEIKQLLAIMTPEKEVFATISETFQRDFMKMVDFFESQDITVKAIKVIGGTSKAGRDFVTCSYEA